MSRILDVHVSSRLGAKLYRARDDYVLSGHRSHGHYLAKGGELKRMLAELYGKVAGCAQGKGGSKVSIVGYGPTP